VNTSQLPSDQMKGAISASAKLVDATLDAVLPRMLSLYEEARNTPIDQPMPDPAMKAPDAPLTVAPTRATPGVVTTVRPKGKSPFRG